MSDDDHNRPDGAARDGEGTAGNDTRPADPPRRPPLWRRPLFWLVAGAVTAVLIVAGILWWLNARQYESTDDAFVDAHIVRLAAEVSGKLDWVAPADNRHVRPGQLLAIIEPNGPEASREQAVAQVAQATAGVKQAEGQLVKAQAARRQVAAEATAGVRQAEGQPVKAQAARRQVAADAAAPLAEAERAARDYARYLALVRIDPAAAARTQVDQARAQAESGAAQALAARRAIGSADADIVVARKGIEAARAQVAAAQAGVRQSDVTVGQLRLTASVSGQVVNRMVNIGSYVSPGTQLMAIVPDALWVTANFKETQLRLMRRGQPVDLRIDAYPDVAFRGHVDSIQRGAGQAFALLPAQNATGNFVKVVQRVPVRILFDAPIPRGYAIGPGMSVVPRVKVR